MVVLEWLRISWSVTKDCGDASAVMKRRGVDDRGSPAVAKDRLDELVDDVVGDITTMVLCWVDVAVGIDAGGESEVGFDNEVLDATMIGQ